MHHVAPGRVFEPYTLSDLDREDQPLERLGFEAAWVSSPVIVVITDAGPSASVLIDAIDHLPRLFGNVLLADLVRVELTHPHAPSSRVGWLPLRVLGV
jgi:hypothetical protein